MKVVICGGGPAELIPTDVSAEYYIGADSGAIHLLEQNIIPNYVTGDLDSITEQNHHRWKDQLKQAVRVSAEKDETDTYLAIVKAIEMNPTSIVLLGVTGGRLDHYQAVLHDVYTFQLKYPEIQFIIQDRFNKIHFMFPGERRIQGEEYKYCSFYAFDEPITEVSLQGFKYSVQKGRIQVGSSLYTSNEVLNEVGSISFLGGICLCIQSREESGE